MSAIGPETNWASEAVEFLADTLPRDPERDGWNDKAMTAYQIGCEALVALGQAQATDWGAIPLAASALPAVLPRWDDICIAVLGLAAQHRLLSYRNAEGNALPENTGVGGYVVLRPDGQIPDPAPNIGAVGALGPARAAEDLLPVLEALGLIAEGHWTAQAEVVLWRLQPRIWGMDLIGDPRFKAAAELAAGTVPPEIQVAFDRMVAISDQDVEDAIARQEQAIAESRLRFGPKARIAGLPTPDRTRKSLAFQRCNQLDWIFFRRWRLSDGWLKGPQALRALEIFHDPLAIQIRRAVLARLYPECPEFH